MVVGLERGEVSRIWWASTLNQSTLSCALALLIHPLPVAEADAEDLSRNRFEFRSGGLASGTLSGEAAKICCERWDFHDILFVIYLSQLWNLLSTNWRRWAKRYVRPSLILGGLDNRSFLPACNVSVRISGRQFLHAASWTTNLSLSHHHFIPLSFDSDTTISLTWTIWMAKSLVVPWFCFFLMKLWQLYARHLCSRWSSNYYIYCFLFYTSLGFVLCTKWQVLNWAWNSRLFLFWST